MYPLWANHFVEEIELIARHEFQVVSKSFDVTSDDPTINPPLVEDQKNPARRDTITIPPSGKVVIRWRSDNPGAWFFHCHVSQVW